ncbi:MAG: GTP-binding protein [Phycisphaerae bacterium]|nr:GTP-binding protein [Phycisphaerae bacterium]
MIPLAFITGFLGSGKTTFLRHVVRSHCGRRLVYLVNEFAPVDVDGPLIECPPEDLISVVGGSIFCRCLVTDFIRHLRAVAERAANSDTPVDGVVIEASGIADPGVVPRMLEETRLDGPFRLARVVSVVDPGTFATLVQTLPNLSAQIVASDVALLNKMDLYPPDKVAETERALRDLNASLEIVRTAFCAADIDLFAPRRAQPLDGQYARCADPNYEVITCTVDRTVDTNALTAALGGLSDVLYRAKGYFPAAAGLQHLDASPSGLTVRPAPRPDLPPRLVFIVRPGARARLEPLLANLASDSPA